MYCNMIGMWFGVLAAGTHEFKVKYRATAPLTMKDYVMIHTGAACGEGHLGGQNTSQPTVQECADQCRSSTECHYFAYNPTETRAGHGCALYTRDGGCPGSN